MKKFILVLLSILLSSILILATLWVFWISKEKAVVEFSSGLGKQNITSPTSIDELDPREFSISINDRPVKFLIVKINLEKYDLMPVSNSSQKEKTIQELAQENSCLLAINGTYFDDRKNPLGLLLEKGVVLNSIHQSKLLTGVFYIDQNNHPGIISINEYLIENDKFAIQAGPIILKSNGSSDILSDNQVYKNRSFIGIDQNHFVYFMVVRENLQKESGGISLFEAYQAFKEGYKNFEIDFSSVLNLDGGASTGIYSPQKSLTEFISPQNIICVKASN